MYCGKGTVDNKEAVLLRAFLNVFFSAQPV